MRSISANRRWRLHAALWLQRLEQVTERVRVAVTVAALGLLVVTGEMLTLLDGRAGVVTIPALRSLHAVAALALLAMLAYRLGGGLVRLGRYAYDQRGIPPETVRALAGRLGRVRGLLEVAWWTALGLLILSGVERYLQARYGGGALPVFPPTVWHALHRVSPAYLYAILLLMAFNRGRVALKRALDYLYAP